MHVKCLQVQRTEPVHRGLQSRSAGNVWSARLELDGRVHIRRSLRQRDVGDHGTAALVRGHGVHELVSTPDDANTGRTIELVSGEHKKSQPMSLTSIFL